MSAVAKEAVEVVETVADVAEETIEALDMISNLNGTTRKQQIIVLVAVGLAGVAVGAGVSHLATKKLLTTKYERLMNEELEATREFYNNRQTVTVEELEHPMDPEEMLEEVSPKKVSSKNEFVTPYHDLDGLNPVAEVEGDVDEVEAVERVSVFETDVEAEWEMANAQNRQARKPYIISKEDYLENETDWNQFCFTYFDADGVLADEKEDMVADPDAVVGNWNLERFGWMSGSTHAVYVRVPEHEMEVEIVKSDGSFAAEVHGFTHSDDDFERRRKGSRVRFGDD